MQSNSMVTFDRIPATVSSWEHELNSSDWVGASTGPVTVEVVNAATDGPVIGRIAERNASGSVYYYVADHLGSSRAMTSAAGAKCYDADFLPYGQEVDYTGSCGSNYKFEGKERDTETGNDDFGARYYRSLVGRWMSPDWSAVPAPVPYANLSNPQTLNLYAMVSDNPETFADLDGHDADGGGVGSSATPDWATLGATQPTTKVACTPSPLGPLCTVTGQTQTVSSDQEKLQNQTQATQQLSQQSENAILKSKLTGPQAIAFESAVLAAGKASGVDPNILVGLANKESSLNPDEVNGSAKGLFQITPARQKDLGLSNADLSDIRKVVSAVAGTLSGAAKRFSGNTDLAIASWTLGTTGTQRLFSSGGMQGVRNVLLSKKHPEYGRVGASYIDKITSFEMH